LREQEKKREGKKNEKHSIHRERDRHPVKKDVDKKYFHRREGK
jgi:hypothetical protein